MQSAVFTMCVREREREREREILNGGVKEALEWR